MVEGERHCPLLIAAPLRLEAWSLQRGVTDARVQRSGMGARRARRAATVMGQDPAAALAIAGLGGALDPALSPGDIVVASALLAPDGRTVDLDAEALVHGLRRAGLPARAGRIACAERPVTGSDRALLAASGACAVDMESFWLAAAAAGRPLAVVRVILDGPHHELWRVDLPRRLMYCLRNLRHLAPVLCAWAVERVAAERAQPGGRIGP